MDLQSIIDDAVQTKGKVAQQSVQAAAPDRPEPSGAVPVLEVSAPTPQAPQFPTPSRSQVADRISNITTQLQQVQQGVDNLRIQQPSTRDQLFADFSASANRDVSAELSAVREEQDVAGKNEAALKAQERIKEREDYYRDREETIRANPEGKLRGALNGELAQLERERSREMADLAFSESIALQRLDVAKQTVAAREADIQAEIKQDREFFKTALEFVDNIPDRERIAIEQSFKEYMAERELGYDKELASYKSTLTQSEFPFSPSDLTLSGAGIYDVIAASAQFDKVLDASDRQSLTKAVNVAGQLQELSDLVNLDSEQYGPIIGRIRDINPLDTNAQQFKALVQGIVPNLARGIYGEVGVLTDTDIENYAQTLPRLTSTEDVQDAMLGLTLKLVRDSVENQLSIAAQNGVNVSGNVALLDQLDRSVGEALAPINMRSPQADALLQAGATRDELEYLFKSGYDLDEVEQYYMGSSPGSGSFDQAIAASAEAIAAIESGGDYGALGPVVPSGQYAGQRALGKYQVMPGNIPSWSREALGYEITPEQFLANPEFQDRIFAHKFGEAASRYGSLEDAASVWFSGRPLADAGGASDVLGTSTPEYVRRFSSNLKNYA